MPGSLGETLWRDPKDNGLAFFNVFVFVVLSAEKGCCAATESFDLLLCVLPLEKVSLRNRSCSCCAFYRWIKSRYGT